MGLPVNIKSSTNTTVDPLDSVPVHLAAPDGTVVDSALVASASVIAVNDVLFSLPTKGVAAVLVDFTAGSGWGIQAESTIDGTTWRACPMQIISRQIDPLSYSPIVTNANRWAALPCGGLVTRLRVTSVGTGTLTAVARTSAIGLTENNLKPRGVSYRISAGTGALVRPVACLLLGLSVDNTAGAKRYLHLYNKTSAPVFGTDTPLVSYPVAAGAVLVASAPEIVFSSGLAWGITSDFSGGAAATGGDVVGSIIYST